MCRIEQLLSSLVRPDNPFSKFMFGNLASLEGNNFRGGGGNLVSQEGEDFHGTGGNPASPEGANFRWTKENLASPEEDYFTGDGVNPTSPDESNYRAAVGDQTCLEGNNLKRSSGELCHMLRQFYQRMYSSHYMTLTLHSSSMSGRSCCISLFFVPIFC